MATLPVHVLTGYLGSGKTTLLNALLAGNALRDAAVVINELGEIGIDHLLVRHVREDVVLLASGCICCALRTDLVSALAQLESARDAGEIPAFSRVFIETTGIAEPGPIVQTLVAQEPIAARYHLEGIVCCVDAELGPRVLASHGEARLQVALADRIVLTKCDRVDAQTRAAALDAVRALNPGAPLAEAQQGALDARFVLAVGHLDTRRIGKHEPHPHAHVQSTSVTLQRPVRFKDFSWWVSAFTQLNAPRVLRLKAVVSALGEDHPIAVQAVQHVVYPPLDLPPMAGLDGRSHVVVLTHGMGADELAEIAPALRALEHDG